MRTLRGFDTWLIDSRANRIAAQRVQVVVKHMVAVNQAALAAAIGSVLERGQVSPFRQFRRADPERTVGTSDIF